MKKWRDYSSKRCPKVKPTHHIIPKTPDTPKTNSPSRSQGIAATLETVNDACETLDVGDLFEKIEEENAEYDISTTKHEIEDCPIEMPATD